MTRIVPRLALLLLLFPLPGCFEPNHGRDDTIEVAGYILQTPPEQFIQWESTPEQQRPPELVQLLDEMDQASGRARGVPLEDDRVETVKQFCKDEWARQVGGTASAGLFYFAKGERYYVVGFQTYG